jgi:flagellar biosynthetic protein FliR
MVSSFEMVPPGTLTLKDGLYRLLLRDSAQMFALGVKIGAPAIAALIFTTLAFALLARAVPQFNVLIAGFPVSIAVGLIFFGLSLQLSLPLVAREVRGLDVELSRLLRAM